MIDISGKREQHVVKCAACNEATPIRHAPPGNYLKIFFLLKIILKF